MPARETNGGGALNLESDRGFHQIPGLAVRAGRLSLADPYMAAQDQP